MRTPRRRAGRDPSARPRHVVHAASARADLTVALATCAEVPGLDEDGPVLLEALAAHGVDAVPAVWDSTDHVDWSRFALVVVRSTWDYAERRNEFLAWAESLPRVLNPAPVLRWNTDKRYLEVLAARAVPVVPTHFFEPGDAFLPPPGRFVVKPAVSAGSRNTASYSDGEAARGHVELLQHAGRTVMVQPYVDAVDARGETALVYIGGRYSHAVRKAALLADGQPPAQGLYLDETITAAVPTEAEHETAERALAALPVDAAELLYARVDVVPGPHRPLVLEVELTEPSLFLLYADGGADRLAEAIADAVAASS